MGDDEAKLSPVAVHVHRDSAAGTKASQIDQAHRFDREGGMQEGDHPQEAVALGGRPVAGVAMHVTQPRHRLDMGDVKYTAMGRRLFISFLEKQRIRVPVPDLSLQHAVDTLGIDPTIFSPTTVNIPADAGDGVGHGFWQAGKVQGIFPIL